MKKDCLIASFIVLLSLPFLVSCNNQIEHININETLAGTSGQLPPTQVVLPSNLCPRYQAPSLLKTPEIPLAELKSIAPDDVGGLIELQRKHIEDLHLYIAKLKSQILQAQARYQVNCRRFQTVRLKQ